MNFPEAKKVPIIKVPLVFENNIQLYIKREDLNHSLISGNKFWKLKYNFIEAVNNQKDTLITFGGAYSNHLYALASVGKLTNIKTIGIVRGEELLHKKRNPTLQYCEDSGMQLFFINREEYRLKNESQEVKRILQQFAKHFIIPEGGTNELAVKGTQEILNTETHIFDYISSAVGTGGTLAGLINASEPHQKVIGFSVLKGNFLTQEVEKYTQKQNFSINTQYHFGGYAKQTPQLKQFIKEFYVQTQIPLDNIYTGKLIYGLIDRIKNNIFAPNSKILAIHTGGLQGNNTIIEK